MTSFAAVLLWHVIALLVVANLGYASNLDAEKLNAEVIYARNGAVATDDRRCSRIGKDILREGGHAADAAVAAALCLGVVSPASSGLGGGAFMLLRQANGVSKAFDMRETAPALASKVPPTFLSPTIPVIILSIHEFFRLRLRKKKNRENRKCLNFLFLFILISFHLIINNLVMILRDASCINVSFHIEG